MWRNTLFSTGGVLGLSSQAVSFSEVQHLATQLSRPERDRRPTPDGFRPSSTLSTVSRQYASFLILSDVSLFNAVIISLSHAMLERGVIGVPNSGRTCDRQHRRRGPRTSRHSFCPSLAVSRSFGLPDLLRGMLQRLAEDKRMPPSLVLAELPL